jgi:hypothetical protein
VIGARQDNRQVRKGLAKNSECKYLPREMTRAYHLRYMYEYECPQGACYDGKTMLIVRLRARNREDIRTCNGDMFVIPNIAGLGGIHIRYALYRLSVDGLHRNMAAIAPPVNIGIYTRNFDWFNGNPYWTAAGSNTRYNEVTNVVRNPMQNTQTGKVQWAWWNHGVSVAWCSDFF